MNTVKLRSYTVPPEEIAISGRNGRSRMDEAALEQLMESISACGIINALIVRPSGSTDHPYELVCGHRRLEAARRLGLERVKIEVQELTDGEAHQTQLVENLQREDLTPLDEAGAIERLLQQLSLPEAAARLGKSRSYLAGRLSLTRLPQDARLALAAGTLSLSVALRIARIPDDALRERVAQRVQQGRPIWSAGVTTYTPVTLEEALDHFREAQLELVRATFDPGDPELLPGLGSCTDCPKRSGNALDLFGDLGDDACTDPPCFLQKRTAGWSRRAEEAKAKGYIVLPDALARKIISSYGRELKPGCGFVAPSQPVGRDGDSRTWLKVAKSAKVKPQTLVVRHPETDKPIQLWRVEDLLELLPKGELALKALPSATGARAETPAAEQDSGPDSWAIAREAAAPLLIAVMEAAFALDATEFLRTLVRDWVDDYPGPQVLKLRELTAGELAKASLQELQAVLAGLYLGVEPDQKSLKAFGVNPRPILAAARQRLLAKVKAPPEKIKAPVTRKAKRRRKRVAR